VETLYWHSWAGESCIAKAAYVWWIAGAGSAATLAMLFVILRIAIRAKPIAMRDKARAVRNLRGGLAVTGVICLGLSLAVPLVGRTTHRIFVADIGLVFEGCAGLSPFSEAVPFDEVTGVTHRTWNAPRSSIIRDEAVLSVRAPGAERVIPLSTDPAVVDPVLLRRVVPAPVIEAWRESLTQRGGSLPAGY
jgi:hypothetical protein